MGGVSEDRRDHHAFLFRPVSFGLGPGSDTEFGIVALAKYNEALAPGFVATWLLLGLVLA